jgi:hypothetical protein
MRFAILAFSVGVLAIAQAPAKPAAPAAPAPAKPAAPAAPAPAKPAPVVAPAPPKPGAYFLSVLPIILNSSAFKLNLLRNTDE